MEADQTTIRDQTDINAANITDLLNKFTVMEESNDELGAKLFFLECVVACVIVYTILHALGPVVWRKCCASDTLKVRSVAVEPTLINP